MSNYQFAILLDGGFVNIKLAKQLKRDVVADDIDAYCAKLIGALNFEMSELLRIYYYYARPASKSITNPIDNSVVDLSKTKQFSQNQSLLDSLELKSHFAIRLGETVCSNWRLGSHALKGLGKKAGGLAARDIVPNISQKGVDLRIGLDIARLALRDQVRSIVVVTGDSDFIPAFKFARREGVRIYLDTMGHGVHRDLRAHADIVL